MEGIKNISKEEKQMNTEFKEALDKELLDEIDRLGGIDVGTDPYKTTVDGLTKLMDRAIEIEKLESEREAKEKEREFESEFKLKQLEEQQKSRESDEAHKRAQLVDERKGRFITNCITVGGLILNIGLTVWGTKKSLKFEETGTITTAAGRNFINKLFKR